MFLDEVLEKLVGTTILSAEVKDGDGLVPDEIRITTIANEVFIITTNYPPASLYMYLEPYQEK